MILPETIVTDLLLFLFLIPGIAVLEVCSLYGGKESNRGSGISWQHAGGVGLLSIFVLGMLLVTGIPSLWRLRFDPRLNLIPYSLLHGIEGQHLANIVLFVPFGFLLPLLWEKTDRLAKVLASGFLFSLCIEIAQLFNLRATDVDDLLMNTLGTAAGFLIFRLFRYCAPGMVHCFRLDKAGRKDGWAGEPWVLLIYLWLGTMVLNDLAGSLASGLLNG